MRQSVDRILPVALEQHTGIEIQALFFPPIVDDPHRLLDGHQSALEHFHGVRAMHGPFADLCPGSPDPLLRDVAMYRIRQAIPILDILKIDHLILHHGYVPNTSPLDDWIVHSTAFWRKVLELVPSGTAIHIENYQENSPEFMLRIIEAVDDPRLGICLDIGHAHAFSRTSVVDWVRICGASITYIHLHDNDGSGDQHLPLGQGNILLLDVTAALEQYAPAAIWALETEPEASLAWLSRHNYLGEKALNLHI